MIVRTVNELGKVVRKLRKDIGNTQLDVAQSSVLRQSTVSAFENEPASSKIDTLFRILAANNLEIEIRPKGQKPSKNEWTEEW